MIKFKQGNLTTMEGKKKDIEVKSVWTNRAKDSVIGAALIAMGVIYLNVTAFKHGSEAFEKAECNTMLDLGIAHIDE